MKARWRYDRRREIYGQRKRKEQVRHFRWSERKINLSSNMSD